MQVAVLRAMQQLSEVYSVMTIASLSELVPFFGFSEVEQIIVEAVKQGYLQACPSPVVLAPSALKCLASASTFCVREDSLALLTSPGCFHNLTIRDSLPPCPLSKCDIWIG